MKKRVCLSVGHSSSDRGAQNGTHTEYDYNLQLVNRIKGKLEGEFEVFITNRGAGNGPSTSAKRINETDAEVSIEFHLNAYNKLASGTEMLYWHSSIKGRKLAIICMDKVSNVLGLPYRGEKGLNKDSRGNAIVRETKMPCIIAESFFIDNNKDLSIGLDKIDDLAEAYAESVREYLN